MSGAIAGTALLNFKHDNNPCITAPIYKEGIFMTGAIAGTALLNFKQDNNPCRATPTYNEERFMAGAIAGTASLYLRKTEGINLVTLTVNNECNSNNDSGCPHCYLQYDGKIGYVSDKIINVLLQDSFRHLAIVGKEPLVNKYHAQKTVALIDKAAAAGKTISLITNGINLEYLQNPAALQFVDISFDGGRGTYSRSSYDSLIKKINESGIDNVNALHTVYQQNIDNISDMARIGKDAPFKIIMFSPYLSTINQGSNSVGVIPIEILLEKFAASKEFMEAKNTLLNIDLFHARQGNISMQDIKKRIQTLGLQDKVKLFETDLLREGVIRVTYDGFVLSPEESLNTAEYHEKVKLKGSLREAYGLVLNNNKN